MQMRTAAALILFAVVFSILAVSSYTRESATWDEPQHLTAGYAQLKFGDYRLDPEHPPFVRMWAALPLLAMPGIQFDRDAIRIDDNMRWLFADQFSFCHQFLYRTNDADRLLYAGRFMIVLLGVLLGVLLFCWARELFGFWPAVVVLGLYLTEPNLLAHTRLVTTDFGLTCFAFGTVYFLWRATRNLSFGNMTGLVVFFALAQVSKFSAILLGPVVVALLVVHVCRRDSWPALSGVANKALAAATLVITLAVTSYGAIWAVYGFRYAPAPGGPDQARFTTSSFAQERSPRLGAVVEWIDGKHLLPNAYSQGFLLGQAKAQKRSAFFAGEYSTEGWWYFFPAAFLIKTPVALILLLLVGLVLCAIRWRTLLSDEVYILLPIAVFLGAAMVAKLNIGLRHVLPIYPFVVLLAGKAVAECLQSKRKVISVALVAVCLFQVVETTLVFPNYLAFFNQLVGGARNGHKYLVDSNLDWGQDLKGLKRWMDRNGVQHINLSYFGTADPAYYGIDCTHLPGAPFFAQHLVANLRLPGYVAVSVTNLRGVYFPEGSREFYKPLLERKPEAVIGYSIYVYRIDSQ